MNTLTLLNLSRVTLKAIIPYIILLAVFFNVKAETISVENISLAPESTKPPTIVIFGASYAKNWKLPELAGYNVVNKGVGGDETHFMLNRLEADVLKLNPDAVIVWGFINDIFRSTPEEVVKKLEMTKKNIINIIETIKMRGSTPIIATEVSITSPNTWEEKIAAFVGKLLGKSGYANYVNGHVHEMNRWLKEYANEKSIAVLDLGPVLSNEDGERKQEYATEDGSHLSVEAYKVLTEYVNKANIQLN